MAMLTSLRFSSKNCFVYSPYNTARTPQVEYRIVLPTKTAKRNFLTGTLKTPADKTKILKGVGGGSIDGTKTANTPHLLKVA
jgi:hypothetical protein